MCKCNSQVVKCKFSEHFDHFLIDVALLLFLFVQVKRREKICLVGRRGSRWPPE